MASSDNCILHVPKFFCEVSTFLYFENILREAKPSQGQVKVFGKIFNEPRLTSFHTCDGRKYYKYSGKNNKAKPMTPFLEEIRQTLKEAGYGDFNSCLVNYYRDGNDSIGWHSDNEREIDQSAIASLSLGATRRFLIRDKYDHSDKREIEVADGDLIMMTGDCQRRFQHHVPKQPGSGPRINLTFRKLL